MTKRSTARGFIRSNVTKEDLLELQELIQENLKSFNLTARNSPTSKVAGCKGFGLVQGLAPCA